MHIDHVTLRTSDLEGTRAFLIEVLGLKDGYRPPFGFPGHWLYEGDEPIVHLVPGTGMHPPRGAEYIDHAGFRMDDYEGIRTKLDALAISYETMELKDLEERRLFIHTPGGILLELVFREGIRSDYRSIP